MTDTPSSFAVSQQERTVQRAIWVFSAVIFVVVVLLNRIQLPAPEGLDIHIFAKLNAMLNSAVSVLLVAGLIAVKIGRLSLHRGIMLTAILLSAIFLVSYVLHHLFAGETRFGGEGSIRWIYYLILVTHIILAAGSLPFILLTAFRGLIGKHPEHRKLAKKVWPIWMYVSVSGVIVYWMISPYY